MFEKIKGAEKVSDILLLKFRLIAKRLTSEIIPHKKD